MAKLPGPEALGAPPSMRSGREPMRIGQIETGDQALIAGMNKLVAAFEGQERHDDELDLARANARLTTGLMELERTFETDPDHETYGERYREGAAGVRREAESLIRNPRALQRFAPRADIMVERGFGTVGRYGLNRRREAEATDLNGTLDQLSSYYGSLTGTGEEEEIRREITRTNIQETLNLARGRGIVQPNALSRLEEQHLQGTLEVDLNRRAQRDPLGTMTELQEGDQRSQVESTGQISPQAVEFMERIQPGRMPATTQARQRELTRLQGEARGLSDWVTGNVTVPLTQLQHDNLVVYGHVRGRDSLQELLPLINTGDWNTVREAMRGSLTAMEQPAEAPDGATPTTTPARRRPAGNETAEAIASGAAELGIRPDWLAGIIHRETAGSMSTNRYGGYGNAMLGLIQFNPENQARYGIRTGMTPAEQMAKVVQYYRDRFRIAGMDPSQATLPQLYAAVLAGDPRLINNSDINGSALSAAREIEQRGQTWWARHGTDAPATHATLSQSTLDEISDGIVNEAPAARYQAIPYDRRRTLLNTLSVTMRNEVRDLVNGDLLRIERQGSPEVRPDGRTSFDLAGRVFTPNQRTAMTLAVQEARRRYEAMAGLNDMTREEGERRIDSLSPGNREEGESYAIGVRVRQRASNFWQQILNQREADPAAAVSGMNLRITNGRRRSLGQDGITEVPDEDDHRVQPSREVATATEGVLRRSPERFVAAGPDGQPTLGATEAPDQIAARMRITNPELTPQERQSIIAARLEAQARLGFTNRAPITRAEATELLNLPQGISDADFERKLREATDRAQQLFGTGTARQVMDAAVSFTVSQEGRRRTAAGFIGALARGETFTQADLQRLSRQQRIDEQEAMFRYGAPSQPLGGGRFTSAGERAENFMAQSEGDLGNPWARYDQPSISPQLTPNLPRDPYAGVSVNNTPRAFASPTQAEIEELKRAPQFRAIFDEMYGPGASARVLLDDVRNPPRPRNRNP